MSASLDGHVAVVTGAGRGIGQAIARRLAVAGADVVIAELDSDSGKAAAAELRDGGGRVLAVQTDVADPVSVEAMVEQASSELGAPSVLVNNAGIAVFADPLRLDDDDWRRCFAVDLDGVWACARACLPHMLERGDGRIVNIASVHSFSIIPGCFPYPVAKHGVLGLTRALAVEYADRGIRVNAICPGYIETQITAAHWETFAEPEIERRRISDLHPMRRLGKPEEVAAAALFLASDESSFVTGTALMVDGGRSVVYHD